MKARIKTALGLLVLFLGSTAHAMPILDSVSGTVFSSGADSACDLAIGSECDFASFANNVFNASADTGDGAWGFLRFTINDFAWLDMNASQQGNWGFQVLNNLNEHIDWSLNGFMIDPGDYFFRWKVKDGASIDALFSTVQQVDAPSSLALLGLGVSGLFFRSRRRA